MSKLTAGADVEADLFKDPVAPFEWSAKDTLDVYKFLVEMADKVSERRQAANNFFLSVNTLLVGFVFSAGGTDVVGGAPVLALSAAGTLICIMWRRSVKSYRQLNSGKFAIITKIEERMPVRPYSAEWAALGRGESKSRYRPFTEIEGAVPFVFGSLYLSAIALELFSSWDEAVRQTAQV